MSKAPNTAILLVGGAATFSGVSIANYPKVVLPIVNRPLYEYLAAVLGAVGVKRLIFCVNPGYGKNFENDLRNHPLPQECLVKETTHGTGGSLREVETSIQGDEFWVVNGDLFLQTDLSQMLAFHRERQVMATVGSWRIHQTPWEMERVEVDRDGYVNDIQRIHPSQEKRSTLRPVGLYLFNSAVLDLIPPGRYFDLKEQLFTTLHESDAPGKVWEITGYCRTISSLEDYLHANYDLLLKRVRFPEMEDAGGDFAAYPEDRPYINPSSSLVEPFVLGGASRVEDQVLILGPTAVGHHCQIESGAIINQCVILGNSRIGKGAHLDRCVIGQGSVVADGKVLREMIVGRTLSGSRRQTAVPLNGHLYQYLDDHPEQSRCQTFLRKIQLMAKRALDVVIAVTTLIIFAPIMLIIALAIKLDSPGEVFFRQARCGLHGRRFTMYKFRSMVSNSEDLKPALQAINEVDGPMFKIVKDPRITRVGKFLRDSNLDELPQFWNVLQGDMSLVGPRPLSMDEMELNPKWRDSRLTMQPGLTGLWQVKAHSKLFFKDWVHHDIFYVENFSLWSDVKIISQTFQKVIRDSMASLRE